MLGGHEEEGVWMGVKAMYGKRVIEMESKHKRKIITRQARATPCNELHLK